ncbi:YegP family protein [Metapseudomonas otitidis]|uniref:YegP family protein n=1 Tax=Metapseudomonas otitidis TaxID=319939 RepID=UPI00244A7C0A|nr:YegP family protein [Pseudomonas otitidis]MDG9779951.1 YegP family protein [Pseudomonas otitidis]
MPGFFELKKYGSGEYRFRLKTREAQVMVESGRYPCRDSAEKAIALFRTHCVNSDRFERRMSSGGKNYFRLKGAGEVILESHLYDSEPTREAAIEAIMRVGVTPHLEEA